MSESLLRSWDAVRQRHNDLLEQRASLPRSGTQQDQFALTIREFVREAQQVGRILESADKRSAAQRVLDYWVDYLSRLTPDDDDWHVPLAEFDPAAAGAIEDLPDEAFPYAHLGDPPRSPKDLLSSRLQWAEQCVAQLADKPLVILFGAADSGRSGLAVAGILPLWCERYRRPDNSASAHYVPQPQDLRWDRPDAALPPRPVLRDAAGASAASLQKPVTSATASAATASAAASTSSTVTSSTAESSVPRLWIIDDLENWLGRADDVRTWWESFVSCLLAAGNRERFLLICRTDARGMLRAIPNLAPLLDDASLFLPPWDPRELAEAIERPAATIGLRFSQGLVAQLTSDVLGDPAALPWLKFALTQLWQRRRRNWIDWSAYEDLGGARLLEQSLETLYTSVDETRQQQIRRCLLRLVAPGLRTDSFTCLRVPEPELAGPDFPAELVSQTVSQLQQHGLVTRYAARRSGDSAKGPLVSLVHPGFVVHWPRLLQWLNEQRLVRQQLLRLIEAATTWDGQQRDPAMLWRNAALIEAQRGLLHDVQRDPPPGITPEALDRAGRFLQESQRQVELADRLKLLRVVAVGVAAVVFFLLWRYSEMYRVASETNLRDATRNLHLAHQAKWEKALWTADYSGALVSLADFRQAASEQAGEGAARQDLRDGYLLSQLAVPQVHWDWPAREAALPADFQEASQETNQKASQKASQDASVLVLEFASQFVIEFAGGRPRNSDGDRFVQAAFARKHPATLVAYQQSLRLLPLQRSARQSASSMIRLTAERERFQRVEISDDARFVVAEISEATAPATSRPASAPSPTTAAGQPAAPPAPTRRLRIYSGWTDTSGPGPLSLASDLTPVVHGFALATSDAPTAVADANVDANVDANAEANACWLLLLRLSQIPGTGPDVSVTTIVDLEIWNLAGSTSSPLPTLALRRSLRYQGSDREVVAATLRPVRDPEGDLSFRAAFALRGEKSGLTVRVVDLREGSGVPLAGEFPVHFDTIQELRFSPRNEQLLGLSGTTAAGEAGTSASGLVRSDIWKIQAAEPHRGTAESARKIRTTRLHSQEGARCFAFSPDGETWACGIADAALLWRLERRNAASPTTLRFLSRLPHRADVFSVAFSPDGRLLVSGSRDRLAQVWNVSFGQPQLPPFRLAGTVTQVAFDARGRHVFAADAVYSRGSLATSYWSLRTGNPFPEVLTAPASVGSATRAYLSPNGQYVVARRHSQALVQSSKGHQPVPADWELWSLNATTGDQRFAAHPPRPIGSARTRGAAFCANSRFLVLWSDEPPAKSPEKTRNHWTFDILSLPEVAPSPTASAVPAAATAADASHARDALPRLQFRVQLPPPEVESWPAQLPGGLVAAVGVDGRRLALAIPRPDQEGGGELWLWTAPPHEQPDGTGTWWHWPLWSNTPTSTTAGIHGGPILALALSADGEFLASASADDTVRLWPLSHPSSTRPPESTRIQHHTADVQQVLFVDPPAPAAASRSASRSALTPRRQLISASASGTVHVLGWSPDLGSPARPTFDPAPVAYHTGESVTAIAWDPHQQLLLAGSVGGKVWIWDGKTRELLALLRPHGRVTQIGISHRGTVRTVGVTAELPRVATPRFFHSNWDFDLHTSLTLLQAWSADPTPRRWILDQLTQLAEQRRRHSTSSGLSAAGAMGDDEQLAELASDIVRRFAAQHPKLVHRSVTSAAGATAASRDAQLTPTTNSSSGETSDLSSADRIRLVTASLSLREWYAAGWHLDAILKPDPTTSEQKDSWLARARIHSSAAAYHWDGQLACRELEATIAALQRAQPSAGGKDKAAAESAAELLVQQAYFLEKMRRWREAADTYQQAIKRIQEADEVSASYLAQLHRHRATCLAEQSDYRGAQAAFHSARELTPTFAASYDPRYSVALLALHLGDREAYERECRELLQLFWYEKGQFVPTPNQKFLPHEPLSSNSSAWINAVTHRAPADLPQIVATAREAIRADSANFQFQSTLAGCLYRQAEAGGSLTQPLLDARAILLLALRLHQDKLASGSADSSERAGPGTPYEWLLLSMVHARLAQNYRDERVRQFRFTPQNKGNEKQAANSDAEAAFEEARAEAHFWLERARQQLAPSQHIDLVSGDESSLVCTVADRWQWWERLELAMLLREAAELVKQLGDASATTIPPPAAKP
ncbi:MAG: hypothetical protein U0935_13270 [Pirellulales bacterium]